MVTAPAAWQQAPQTMLEQSGLASWVSALAVGLYGALKAGQVCSLTWKGKGSCCRALWSCGALLLTGTQHIKVNGWLQLAHTGSLGSSSIALQQGNPELLVLHPFVLSPSGRSSAAMPTKLSVTLYISVHRPHTPQWPCLGHRCVTHPHEKRLLSAPRLLWTASMPFALFSLQKIVHCTQSSC